jgi:hypothetical protein
LNQSITNGNPARIAHIYAGSELARIFGDPTANDRTPDISVLLRQVCWHNQL